MNTNRTSWIENLRESAAALVAGARMVPLGDNGEAQHSLAVRLAEMRADAVLGRRGPRRFERRRADDLD